MEILNLSYTPSKIHFRKGLFLAINHLKPFNLKAIIKMIRLQLKKQTFSIIEQEVRRSITIMNILTHEINPIL